MKEEQQQKIIDELVYWLQWIGNHTAGTESEPHYSFYLNMDIPINVK